VIEGVMVTVGVIVGVIDILGVIVGVTLGVTDKLGVIDTLGDKLGAIEKLGVLKKKTGFTSPVGHWIRSNPQLVNECIEFLALNPLFDPNEVRKSELHLPAFYLLFLH
jgi:hypothetical protein